MFSIRARTLRGLSSFFERSLGLSGSRCPIAHCPSPRGLRAALVGTVMDSRLLVTGDTRSAPATRVAWADHGVRGSGAARAPHPEWVRRREQTGQTTMQPPP